jgi:cation:H+ antiporter
MSNRGWWKILLAFGFGSPALVLRLAAVELSPVFSIGLYGGAVVAAAFLLSWAGEAFQLDVSPSLATAALALIAVLPEYAVDLYFAFSAGRDPSYAQYAAANMTGSNRLLIGIGWPLVAMLSMVAARRARQDFTGVWLKDARRVELAFLALASVYSAVIILDRRLAWDDALVLLGLFVLYLVRVSREERIEPELIGVAAAIGQLAPRPRRLLVGGLFLSAAAIVLASAKPFSEALVAGGKQMGVDEFLLVQWLAPLTSEAPELLVAALLALRGHQDSAFGTVLSSKVNQWTLLVGSLPIAYYAGGGQGGLPLDARQVEEFVLTASQGILGFSVLCNLELRRWEAVALLFLFLIQFPLPGESARLLLSAAYMVLSFLILVVHRRSLLPIARALVRIERSRASRSI